MTVKGVRVGRRAEAGHHRSIGTQTARHLFLPRLVAILTIETTMVDNPDLEGAVLTRSEEELKTPDEYRVILINDDFTTMEFVVSVLMAVFHKPIPEATTNHARRS